MEQATPLSQLQPCHVISYENKLLPLILTYCQYCLQYGKGTEIEYDTTAIEKDLFEKFIFGKPLILIDEMPIVVLSNDDTFYESIATKVPQVNATMLIHFNLFAIHTFNMAWYKVQPGYCQI